MLFSDFADSTEKQYFEWFQYRTAKKIPGLFVLTFWDKLLLQASSSEPAVFNSVLTLSSVHNRQIANDNIPSQRENVPDVQEQFMLQHYSKAIRCLQPHFLTKDRTSVRIALIACVVFVCLEFLRGHFKTAQAHLESGLKVLREKQGLSDENKDANDMVLFFKPSHDATDDWIAEAFSRLQVQVELFRQSHRHRCLVLQFCNPGSPNSVFHTINEAWQHIERSLNKIFILTEQGRRHRVSEKPGAGYPSALLKYQQHVQEELARWLATYDASRNYLQSHPSESFAYLVLCTYHTMANIMANVCLWLDDECIFDRYTKDFVSLINHSANNRKTSLSSPRFLALSGSQTSTSRSVIDIGWIPPLYYTALKCRVHRVRLQAIRLLECTSHREGIWDAKIAACVARKVMDVEEKDFYKDFDTANCFPLFSSPGLEDLSLPTLPESYRIHDVEVVLPDGPTDNVLLYLRRKQKGGHWKKLKKEYHMFSQSWIDEETDEVAEM